MTCPIKDLANLETIKNIGSFRILTNPPYGERLNDKETIVPIYKDLKNVFDKTSCSELHVITSYDNMKNIFGTESKNRKVYNGMIKTYLYSYIR